MVLIAAGTAIAIVTVISVTSTNPATADVVRVQSPLTATGREHACPDESLTFTCEVNGQYIQWTFNSYYRTTFFYDDSVNTTETVSEQYGVRAVLTGNDPIPDSPNADVKHLSAALIIDSSNSLNGYLHNISCHSDTGMHVQQLKLAEIPNRPRNVQVSRAQLSTHQETNTLSVVWDAPYNLKNFDLKYFEVSILSDQAYIANGTTTELEYHFNSDVIPPQTSVHIMVTAISKCSQKGRRSYAVEWRDIIAKAVSTNAPDPVKDNITTAVINEAEMINGYKEPMADIHKVLIILSFVTTILSL